MNRRHHTLALMSALTAAARRSWAAALATQSCELMLHPSSGFFRDVQLDAQGVRRVLALRSKLAQPVKLLSAPARYIDERYWLAAQRG